MKVKWFEVGYTEVPKRVYLLWGMKCLIAFHSVLISVLSLLFHDKMNFSTSLTGRLISLVTIVGAVGLYCSGIIASRIGENRTIKICLGVSLVCFLIAFLIPLSKVFCIIFLLGILSLMAITPVCETVISKSVEERLQKRVFSLCYLGTNVGYGIFVLVITSIYVKYLNYVCLLGCVMCILLLVLFHYYQKAQPIQKVAEKDKITEQKKEKVEWKKIFRKNGLFFLVVILFCMVYSQYGFSIPLQLNRKWGESGVSFFGTLGGVNAAVVILCTPVLTSIFNSKREPDILSLSAGIYAASFLVLFIQQEEKWTYVVWILGFTLAEILYSISISVYVARNNEEKQRTMVYAILNVSVLLGYIIGQNVSGMIGTDYMGLNFVVVSAMSGICAVLCRYFLKSK